MPHPTYTDPVLKPCPFCGSADGPMPVVTPLENGPDEYCVQCTVCRCRGPQLFSEEPAVYDWNKRATGGTN